MTTNNTSWTVLKILNATTDYFSKNKFEHPRLNAERLLSHVLNLDRVHLYLEFERLLTPAEIKLYRSLVKRRSENEPLQYIVGKAEFMGLSFEVNSHVLIPRPETEILVENTLALKQHVNQPDVHIWDIGTGSGCIAVSVAHYWPECQILATDNSGEALEMAKKNAQLNQVSNIIFKQHDILQDAPGLDHEVEVIVSNPPYISKMEYADLNKEIVDFEPVSALSDHKDGLEFYRRILALLDKINGCKFVLLEMSGTQTNKILNLVKSCGYDQVEVVSDLNQIPRILKISL